MSFKVGEDKHFVAVIRKPIRSWVFDSSLLSPHIHWVENANSVIIAWVLPLHSGSIAITSLLLLNSQKNPLTGSQTPLQPAHPTQGWKLLSRSGSLKSGINQFKGLQGLLPVRQLNRLYAFCLPCFALLGLEVALSTRRGSKHSQPSDLALPSRSLPGFFLLYSPSLKGNSSSSDYVFISVSEFNHSYTVSFLRNKICCCFLPAYTPRLKPPP